MSQSEGVLCAGRIWAGGRTRPRALTWPGSDKRLCCAAAVTASPPSPHASRTAEESPPDKPHNRVVNWLLVCNPDVKAAQHGGGWWGRGGGGGGGGGAGAPWGWMLCRSAEWSWRLPWNKNARSSSELHIRAGLIIKRPTQAAPPRWWDYLQSRTISTAATGRWRRSWPGWSRTGPAAWSPAPRRSSSSLGESPPWPRRDARRRQQQQHRGNVRRRRRRRDGRGRGDTEEEEEEEERGRRTLWCRLKHTNDVTMRRSQTGRMETERRGSICQQRWIRNVLMEIQIPHAGCQPAPRPRPRHTPASGDVTVTYSSEVQIYDTREGSSSRQESINVLRNKKKKITVFTFKIRVLINVLRIRDNVSDLFPPPATGRSPWARHQLHPGLSLTRWPSERKQWRQT